MFPLFSFAISLTGSSGSPKKLTALLLTERELFEELAPMLCPPVLEAGRCVGLEESAVMEVKLIADGRRAGGSLDGKGLEGDD